MYITPVYTIIRHPVLITEKGWYELVRGPYELEDGSYLYLARATGKIFPDSEFASRRYYIRIARAGKETIRLSEERMDDKLLFRGIKVNRIADQIHMIGDYIDEYFGRKGTQAAALKDYVFTVAKIHNHKEWMDEATIPLLPNINAEKIRLVDMGLSVQAFKYLLRAKIDNMKKLVSLTKDELCKICHGNEAVMDEIEKVVEKYDLYFVKLPE